MKLSHKVMVLTVGIAFLTLFSASGFGYFFGMTETRSHINSYLTSEAQGTVCRLEGWIGERASVIRVLESVISEMENPALVSAAFLKHYQKDPDISDIYIGFEDGRFISGLGWQPPPEYDPRIRPWYTQAKAAGRLNYSEPYLDMTTGKYAVSVGIPLKDKQGRLIGILAEDILLETLTQRVQEIDLDGLGYGFLLDRNGTGLSHPDPALVNADVRQNPDTREIVARMMAGGNGIMDYTFRGIPKIMVYRTMPSTGWLLGVAVEKEEIFRPLEQLRNFYLISGFGIMFLVLLMSQVFSKQLTRRLGALAAESRRISAGAASFELKPEGGDEIAELTGAFGTMAGSLSQRIQERDEAFRELDQTNLNLEKKVEERTAEVTAANQELLAINDELASTLEKLRTAQRQLVESERMAALGGMVAGIAHEINTPVGIGVTGATYLEREIGILERKFNEKALRTEELQEFFGESREVITSITRNLDRADHLIKSFKLVSADQTHDEERTFNMREYLEALTLSLTPLLKKTPHRFSYQCPEDLNITSYPAAYAQIITNFVTNSIHHGFRPEEAGELQLEIARRGSTLSLLYRDNGHGMTEEVRDRIFEPFYTTRRSDGSMGLGLHLVYNIVTEQLGGTVECTSEPGQGTAFAVSVPLEI